MSGPDGSEGGERGERERRAAPIGLITVARKAGNFDTVGYG